MKAWIYGIVRTVRYVASLHVGHYAAGASFFLALSVFPGLIVLVGALRLLPVEPRSLGALLTEFLPGPLVRTASMLLRRAWEGAGDLPIGLWAAVCLWSASRGVYGMILGFNAVCGFQEHRSWLVRRLTCLGCTLALLAALILTLAAGLWPRMVLAGVFWLLLRILPAHGPKGIGSLPGAALAGLGWHVFCVLCAGGMVRAGGLYRVYGPVYLLCGGMLWLWGCIWMLLLGGVVNTYLEENARKKRKEKN